MKTRLIPAILAIFLLSINFLRADPVPIKDLVPDSFGEGRQPQVAVTSAGTIVVVFAQNN